jgi:zinc protease
MLSDAFPPLTNPFDRAITTSETNASVSAGSISAVPSLRTLVQNAIANADLSQPRIAQALNLPVCVTLSNGMTLYFQQREDTNASQPFASLRLVVRTGYMSEDFALAEQQMAHLVEHGLFQGTESFSAEEIKKLMEEILCPLGADGSAHTDFHETVYKFNNVPTAGLAFGKCLRLMFEFACKATFPPEALLKERAIVEDEILKLKGYESEYSKFVHSQVYAGSGQAEHLFDNPFDPKIKNCDGKELHQRLMNFYKKWYQPHNMALIVVGDFDENAGGVFQFIEKIFKSIPAAKEQGLEEYRLKKAYPVPPRDKILYACFTHSQLSESYINIQTPISDEKRLSKNPREKERFFFKEFVHSICLAIFRNRLASLRSSPDCPFTYYSFSPLPSMGDKFTNFNKWQVYADQGKLVEAFKSFTSHIFTFYKKGITESELTAIKNCILRAAPRPPIYKDADLAGDYAFRFSNETTLAPYLTDLSNQMYYLKKVSRADVEEVIKEKWNLFTPEVQKDISISAFHPINGQPSSLMTDLREWFEKIPIVKPIQETIQLRDDFNWLPKRPAACKPVIAQHIKQIKSNELQFENGIRVFLKSVKQEPSTILLKMMIPHGLQNMQSRSDLLALELGFTVLQQLGLADRTSYEVIASLKTNPILKSNVMTKAALTHCEFQTECESMEGLKLALQMLYSRLENLQPIYSDEFKRSYLKVIKNKIDGYTAASKTENGIFSREACELVLGEHPLLKSRELKDFDSITVEQCQEAIKECFQNLSKSTLVICGNFDCNDVTPLVNSYVGALSTSPIKGQKKQRLPLPFPTENKEKIFYEGEEKDRSKTLLTIPIVFPSSAKDSFLLRKSLFVLLQYLRNTIRFKEQLIYSFDSVLLSQAIGFNLLEITFSSSSSLHDKVCEHILKLLTKAPEQAPKLFLEGSTVVRNVNEKKTELGASNVETLFSRMCEYVENGFHPIVMSEEIDWESTFTDEVAYRILQERIFANPRFIKLTMHPKNE